MILQVRDHVSDSRIGMMRIQYWKDSLDRIYEASVMVHLLLSYVFLLLLDKVVSWICPLLNKLYQKLSVIIVSLPRVKKEMIILHFGVSRSRLTVRGDIIQQSHILSECSLPVIDVYCIFCVVFCQFLQCSLEV